MAYESTRAGDRMLHDRRSMALLERHRRPHPVIPPNQVIRIRIRIPIAAPLIKHRRLLVGKVVDAGGKSGVVFRQGVAAGNVVEYVGANGVRHTGNALVG